MGEADETAAENVVDIHRGTTPSERWHPVTRGVQRLGDAGDPFLADLRAWHVILKPTACFTHLTSARIRGWWLPPVPDWAPTFVCMNSSQNPPRRPGLHVTRHTVASSSEIISGVRVASPAETIVACAGDLCVLDLAVIIDCALHRRAVSVEELWAVARQHRRGAPRLREALTYVDDRSESAWESLLRILHVACKIDVEPQRKFFDADGLFVARGDLWLVGTTSVHEYDGEHHLARRQQREDLRRARRLVDLDLIRRGYTSDDVLHRSVSILRDADAAVGRPHEPARIRPWLDLLSESLFTGAGKSRLRRRLRIDPKTGGLGA